MIFNQYFYYVCMPIGRRIEDGRPAGMVYLGLPGEQELDHRTMSGQGREHDGGFVGGIPLVKISPRVRQQLDDIQRALARGQVQRRLPCRIDGIRIDSAPEQLRGHAHIAGLDRIEKVVIRGATGRSDRQEQKQHCERSARQKGVHCVPACASAAARGNSRKKLPVVSRAMVSIATPFSLAISSATCTTKPGSLTLPRCGTGAR